MTLMPLAQTLKETTTARVTLGTMVMDSPAIVSFECSLCCWNEFLCILDTDECTQETDTCHEDAICMDTNGRFVCMCEVGYTRDGFNCSGKYCEE